MLDAGRRPHAAAAASANAPSTWPLRPAIVAPGPHEPEQERRGGARERRCAAPVERVDVPLVVPRGRDADHSECQRTEGHVDEEDPAPGRVIDEKLLTSGPAIDPRA